MSSVYSPGLTQWPLPPGNSPLGLWAGATGASVELCPNPHITSRKGTHKGVHGTIMEFPVLLFKTNFNMTHMSRADQLWVFLWLTWNCFSLQFTWGIIPSTPAILPHSLMRSNLAFQNLETLSSLNFTHFDHLRSFFAKFRKKPDG